MRQNEEVPKLIVNQTFLHLKGIYLMYSLCIICLSCFMWGEYAYMDNGTNYLHLFITGLLIGTPYVLMISENKHSLHFYTNHLELLESTGEYLAAITYKDIQKLELHHRERLPFGCKVSMFTYFYISDGDTTIKLQALSLPKSDRLYLMQLLQK